jgi:hypothetical protein
MILPENLQDEDLTGINAANHCTFPALRDAGERYTMHHQLVQLEELYHLH